MTAHIYGLLDNDGDLRYIGKANNPTERLVGHMRQIGRRKTPLYDWLAKHGLPTMIVLEDDCDDWRWSERAWIASARLADCRLLNLADGGDEPFCSLEQRRANARKSNNRFRSEDARRYARETNAKLAADPRAKQIKDMKSNMGRHIAKYGLTPEQWAKLAFLGVSKPKTFGKWVQRQIDRNMPTFDVIAIARYEKEVEALCA